MKNGMSLTESLMLLEDDASRPVITVIQQHLQNGERLSSFFADCLPHPMQRHFRVLIRCLSLSDSLNAALAIRQKEKEKRRKLVQGLLYPVLLVSGVFLGVWLFSLFILPRMIALLEAFAADSGGFADTARFFSAAFPVFAMAALAILITAGVACSRSHIRKTYAFLAVHLPDNTMVRHASESFARYYAAFLAAGVSTRDALGMLKEMPERPLTQMIAAELDRRLLNGSGFAGALSTPLVETRLTKCLRIAMHASNASAMLEGYLQMSEAISEARIRRFTRHAQLLSYFIIGLVLILVYQILMAPMSILQSI